MVGQFVPHAKDWWLLPESRLSPIREWNLSVYLSIYLSSVSCPRQRLLFIIPVLTDIINNVVKILHIKLKEYPSAYENIYYLC